MAEMSAFGTKQLVHCKCLLLTQSGHRRGGNTEALGIDQKVKFVTTITSRSRNRPYYSNVG